MMDRQKIVTDIFESWGVLGRTMMLKGPHSFPEGMPTHAQIGVLFCLSHNGPIGIKQIAEKFQMTSSAATQLVNSLVKDALLIRIEDGKDRRKITVELTEKGKEKLEQAKKFRLEKIKKMLEPLSDEELMQLKNIYWKITDRL